MGGQLDTSGGVIIPGRGLDTLIRWTNLTPCAQGRVEAMFAELAAKDVRRPVRAGNAPTSSIIAWMPLGFSDLAPATLAKIIDGGPHGEPYLADDGLIYFREAGQ